MYYQKALLDSVRSFSPDREEWVSKPAEGLPQKVTVTFKTGQTGLLDMKNPRAVQWAGMIDRAQRAGQPVYVEIDKESNVITNVRIPKVYTVRQLDTDEAGNLLVQLQPSHAVHLLLRSNPDFASMQASLQAALADGSERLITETRDEHEIIDVRLPESGSGGSSGPAPPAPDDPAVSEARAGEVFNAMNGESCDPCNPSATCIPFLYPDDGCWIRAHIMCHLMRDPAMNPAEDPGKVWIDFPGLQTVNTSNHPDCHVRWGWHVAPTLDVNLSGGGTEKRVIDPSLSPGPESEDAWRLRQGDPTASLTDTSWVDYNWVGDTRSISLAQAQQDMDYWGYRDELRDRCLDVGPPPYSCTRNCFFIMDRSTFSDDEVEAMLHVASPAVVQDAFYIVLDGYSPDDPALGFTSATMQHIPNLTTTPAAVPGMTITADRLEFEYPTHLNRRQRLTWVYKISFTDISAFTSAQVTVPLNATIAGQSATGYLYLIQQPNPYEVDGATSWLSTDLRVFQIKAGESKFGVTMGSDPSTFITQVITALNTGNTGGQTFENNISTDQQTSRLELSQTVQGTAVYNFAVAKVRYQSLYVPATDVRVFFRLFPVATTSLEYDQATAYRRYEAGTTVVPLLGIKNGEIAAIPCFASPRIDSAAVSMTTQTDAPNVMPIPQDASGALVVRYFGCWLDINQPQVQFPLQPSPSDGPFGSGRFSIQDLIRNEHQCLVSEIAFTPAPAQNGSTPSTSDKLAQRNLAIVQSANPGVAFSRRIPQTFEIRPSSSKPDNDELMIDWGNVPVGSVATVYLPGLDASDIRRLAAHKYRSHRLVRIDEHTLRFDTGGITYLPIPFTDQTLAGLLTVDLPEGIVKGQVFTVVVRQIASQQERVVTSHRVETHKPAGRRIVGSFQLTIPVADKADILPRQQRLLSNLRWIERAIPAKNRWAPVFHRYVSQIAGRVDALGGDSSKVAPSASGQWEQARTTCLTLSLLIVLLLAALVIGIGVLRTLVPVFIVIVLAALAGAVSLWRKKCRPAPRQWLRRLLAGTGIGAVVLALLAIFGVSTPQLIPTLIASVVIAVLAAILLWAPAGTE